jgi:L-2,4-diaminobutyrate decarboxylase
MSRVSEDLIAARRRIDRAYDPHFLEEAGHRLAGLLAMHLEHAQRSQGPVLPWVTPPDAIADAQALLGSDADDSNATEMPLADRFARLVQTMLERGLNLHDPRYIGHQVPAPVPIAGLFDAVGSVTNQVMAIYEMGPWATAVEQAMVRQLGEIIGWAPGTFAGSVTHGGSLANLTALLTARNVCLGDVWGDGLTSDRPQPLLVVHADAHYSVARAAGILGLGTRQIVRAGLDEQGRMDPERLDTELARLREEQRPIVAVVSCACATPTGAFDPLLDIASVCRRHGVWLHVDAAHGGAAMLSERHRHLLAGLDQADSVVWDAHKMLFVPALCAFVFYRNRGHAFAAFSQDAPYLFDPAAPGLAEYDSGMRTVECTKRAAAFGLWGVWSLFGRQLFADMVDVTFALGRIFYEKLRAADDFVPLHDPQCNIVVFRHVPSKLRDADSARVDALQLELRRRLVESGEFYIVPTRHKGVGALRVTIINPLTTPEHLDRLMDALRRQAQELMRD